MRRASWRRCGGESGVAEVREGDEPGAGARRGGSSAMPHKRNPVAAIAILGCTRQVPGLLATLAAAAEQEHQRAAGAWHSEWEPFSGLLRLTGSAASWGAELLAGLTADPARMRANLDAAGGFPLAERVSGLLAPAVGAVAAHDLVAEASAAAAAAGLPLRAALLGDPDLRGRLDAAGVTPAQVEAALDPAGYLGAAGEFIDAALAAHRAGRGLTRHISGRPVAPVAADARRLQQGPEGAQIAGAGWRAAARWWCGRACTPARWVVFLPDAIRHQHRRASMDDASRAAQGMTVRREVLGDAHVDRVLAGRTAFSSDFQDLIARYAWGDIWSRPGLSRAERSMLTLTALTVLRQEAELAIARAGRPAQRAHPRADRRGVPARGRVRGHARGQPRLRRRPAGAARQAECERSMTDHAIAQYSCPYLARLC